MRTTPVDIREAGTITEVRRGVVKLAGLPTCIMGQLLDLGGGARGFVVGFTDTEVLALVLGEEARLAVGQEVLVSQQPLRVPASDALLGRMVAPTGEPLDGEPAPAATAEQRLFQEAPGIMTRVPVDRQLGTGVRVIDAMIPIGKGQRQLIIGDRMTGKTTLALDAILSQQGRAVVCIYCSIGQAQQKLRHVADLLRERRAFDYTVILAAPASRQASEQFLAPYAACALGEYFMAQGRDVLVVFDDLTKHAWAYRQLSLLLERPPGREAYPGDMFYVHAQFMERAGQMDPDHGGGSMTFLPICETQQGDVTGYVCSNLISMTDGQLYLSSELFYEGVKPAVDVGLSVSRIGNKVQSPLLRDVSGRLRLELLQHQELLRLSRFSASRSEQAERRARRGALVRRLITQAAHALTALDDLAVLLYALKTGRLDGLSDAGLRICLAGFGTAVPEEAREMIRTGQLLTPAMYAQLDAALEAFLQPFRAPEPEVPHAV